MAIAIFRRVFKDKIFDGPDAEMKALRWSIDMELEGWNTSRISKLAPMLKGERAFVCLVWKWVQA